MHSSLKNRCCAAQNVFHTPLPPLLPPPLLPPLPAL
jgi:hypothetical protein